MKVDNNEKQYEKLQNIDLSDPKNASQVQPFHECQRLRKQQWYKTYLQDRKTSVVFSHHKKHISHQVGK